MGFLDSQERIVDMTLTREGRRQLASGELRFIHYAFFDDGIDYSPVISSGSMTTEQIDAAVISQIEATPAFEAISGLEHERLLGVDGIGTRSFLFTAPQGQRYLARATFDPDTLSGSVQVDQRRIEQVSTLFDRSGKVLDRSSPTDVGFERLRASAFTVDVGVTDFFAEQSQAGFIVSVLMSGSDGLTPIDVKLDSLDEESIGAELKLFFDEKFRARMKP